MKLDYNYGLITFTKTLQTSKAQLHEHEITNETFNNTSAQRQTRHRFISKATLAWIEGWWNLVLF